MKRASTVCVIALALAASSSCGAGIAPGVGVVETPVLASPLTLDRRTPVLAEPVMPDVVWTLHDRFVQCLVQPPDCDPSSIAVTGSPAFDDLTALVAERQSSGLRARAPDNPLTRHILRHWVADRVASVEWCWVDDLVLMDDSTGSGHGIIVDESEHTLAESWTLSAIDAEWRLSDRNVTHLGPGRSTWCG